MNDSLPSLQSTPSRSGLIIKRVTWLLIAFRWLSEATGATIFSEDFEGATLTAANPDYARPISGWTHTNLSDQISSNPSYDGGAVLDIDEWIAEQGVQVGRNSSGLLTGNNALIFDPDAWDDFVPNIGSTTGYSSIWRTEIDLTGYDPASVQISFSYEFATLDDQSGQFSVALNEEFSPKTNLLTLLSTEHDDHTILSSSPTYTAGTDFPVPTGNSLWFQAHVYDAGNDWWMAVDNIQVTATPVPELSAISSGTLMLILLGIAIANRRILNRCSPI